MSERRALCTFEIDGLWLAVDAVRVREVVRHKGLTRIPLAPPAVLGMMNLRGQTVVALDVRSRLSLPTSSENGGLFLVMETGDAPAALRVDEVRDVVEVSEDGIEAVPDTVQGAMRTLLRGVHQLEGGILLEIETDRVVEIGPPGGDSHGVRPGCETGARQDCAPGEVPCARS